MSDKRDYYQVLGVERGSQEDEIKRAYRKLAMQFHPDRNQGDPDAERRFKEAAEAYDVLGDAQKRARYDQYGHAAFAGAGSGAGFTNVEDIFSTFSDIFGGSFGDLFGGGRRARNGPRTGRSLRIVLDLTLEEIDQGVERVVAIKRFEACGSCSGSGSEGGKPPVTCTTCAGAGQVRRSQGFFVMASACPTCAGAGRVIADPCRACGGQGKVQQRREVTIEVPPGIEEGVQIRISGEGDAGDPGAPSGDVYCVVREKEHKLFQRSGADLLCEVPFAFSELALGDKVEIPTLRGRAEMTIPAGTPSGKVFRLRGQGLPHLERRGRGDQLVRVFVEVPTKLTERQRELLTEFAEIEQKRSGNKSFFDKIASLFS
jgi:molecular chaperone DnaJ